jgi:hypothetical protein
MFDCSGKAVLKQAGAKAGNISVPVDKLSKGVYVMRLTTVNNEVEIIKIVK